MGRDTIQLETVVNTISQEYLLEFTSEYGIPEALHPELPRPEDRIVDFPEGKQEAGEEYPPMLYQALGLSQKLEQSLFWVDERVFPTVMDWRTSAPKDGMPAENTGYTPYPHPETARDATLLSGNKSQILHGGRDMDLFSLIRAPNLTKVKTRSRPCAVHEVPLLTVTTNRVIKMEDPAVATDSSGVPSTIERSSLDFANEAEASDQGTTALEVLPSKDVPTTRGAHEAGQAKEVTAINPSTVIESCKRGHDGVDANAPPKVLRRDHADPWPTGSTRRGKSLATIELGMASTRPVPVPESTPVDVSDPDPLSFADPQSHHPADVAQSSQGTAAAGDLESKNASFAFAVGSPESIYRPEWGVANGSMLDTPEACQDLVDHVAPPGYFSELRHLHNDDFLRQYNVNLARQVAMGSHLRLRFEQEAKLLKKSVAQVARRDKRIQAREHEIKNLEALLEAEVATLQEQVSRKEKLKAAFEEFKQYEDNRVEQRCAKMDARLDALSIDFDEELYPHMLTAIAGHRWMIGCGLHLAVIKCGESLELRQAFADVVSAGIAKGMSEGLRHGVKHGQAQLSLESIEAYDPKGEAKNIAALQALKDLKYPLVDQFEGLKDAPMDVIMVALYLKSDTRDDIPQQIRDLRPSSSQLTIPVYPEKKKCRIVCHTHGVGSAHHARSDGVPVSVPTVVPYGLSILLADAATQTEPDEATLDNFVMGAPWESLHILDVLGMALRTQSPRPPGLQPVYAAGRV
nr:hypothetical protein [Tanacetum cinerariifolium]